MDELINALKVLLADSVALKFKAHGYHWNVESDDFPQMHEFYGKVYENYEDSIDTFAEWIRILDAYAPFKLSRFQELTTIPDTDVTSNPEDMNADLYASIEIFIAKLKTIGSLANTAGEYGLANFLADRQTASQKFCWQLRASLKDVGE